MSPGLASGQVGGRDHNAPRTRRRRQKLFHPGIVVGAIDDNDLRLGDLADSGWRCFEQMRILVRIAHDADDGDTVAADLACDVAVEIFCRDHADLIVGGHRGKAVADTECKGEAGKRGFHGRPISYAFC